MRLKIKHFIVINHPKIPQIFIVGKEESDKFVWVGIRLLHMVDDSLLPFVQSYSETCPIVSFRFFFLPIRWRKKFIIALFSGEVPANLRKNVMYFEEEKEVIEYLKLRGKQLGESVTMKKLVELFQDTVSVSVGSPILVPSNKSSVDSIPLVESKALSLHEFTLPMMDAVLEKTSTIRNNTNR